jgi:uncharacterized surface anchored protein
LTIAKTDEDTGKPLSGVTFDVYKDGNKVATVTTGTDGKKTLTLKTKYSATAEVTKEYCSNYGQLSEKNKALVDADYYSKSDALVAANAEALAAAKKAAEVNFATKHTYKVVETATKTAYYLNPNSTTKSTSYSSGDGNGTITFSFTNKRQLGSITITKKDAMTNNLLEGAIYGLYANENIKHPDGNTGVLYAKDALVAQFPATDKNGKATLNNLYLGSYYVKEITAPSGYELNDAKTIITLSPAKSSVEIVSNTSAVVYDTSLYGSIKIVKKDNRTNALLEGATFKICAAEDITDPKDPSKTWKKDDLVATLITGENGTDIQENLLLGKYYLQEVTAPVGYGLDTAKINVVLSAEKPNRTVHVTNATQTGNITIIKTDAETDNPLAFADFWLFAKEDIYSPTGELLYKKDQAVKLLITDENGLGAASGIPAGKYYLQEGNAPVGYFASVEPVEIELSYNDDGSQSMTFSDEYSNKAQRGEIHVTQQDTETNNIAQGDGTLEGAIFGLYAKEDIVHHKTK